MKQIKDFFSSMAYSAEVAIMVILISMMWLIQCVLLLAVATLPMILSPWLGLVSIPVALWFAITIIIREFDK